MARQPTPAGRQRSRYAAAIRARGASGYNIWIVQPPNDPAHELLLLASDVEFDTFFFLEGDPELRTLDYGPLRECDPDARPRVRHFAVAVTCSEQTREVRLDPGACADKDPRILTITLPKLVAARTRIHSWRAIVPAINRCRNHELRPLVYRIRRQIEAEGEAAVGALCDGIEEPAALVLGAIGTLLRSRELASDVEQQLWSPATRLWNNDEQ